MERVQRDGYYRDKEGKIQTPLIMFKRDSVEKRRDLGNKMDANNPQLYNILFKKNIQKEINMIIFQYYKVEHHKELHAVVVPDYVTKFKL